MYQQSHTRFHEVSEVRSEGTVPSTSCNSSAACFHSVVQQLVALFLIGRVCKLRRSIVKVYWRDVPDINSSLHKTMVVWFRSMHKIMVCLVPLHALHGRANFLASAVIRLVSTIFFKFRGFGDNIRISWQAVEKSGSPGSSRETKWPNPNPKSHMLLCHVFLTLLCQHSFFDISVWFFISDW